jgi:hypothetical protein
MSHDGKHFDDVLRTEGRRHSLVRGLFLVERMGDIRGEGGVAMVAGERRIVHGKMRVALRKTLRRLLSRLSLIRAEPQSNGESRKCE